MSSNHKRVRNYFDNFWSYGQKDNPWTHSPRETSEIVSGKTVRFGDVGFTINSKQDFVAALIFSASEMKKAGASGDACEYLVGKVFKEEFQALTKVFKEEFPALTEDAMNGGEVARTFLSVYGNEVASEQGSVRINNEVLFAGMLGAAFSEAKAAGQPVKQLSDVCDYLNKIVKTSPIPRQG